MEATKVVPSKSQGLDHVVVSLYANLFADLQRRYPADCKSLNRDFETLRTRILTEGLSFATKTLPKLGKAFDRALETGSLEVPRDFKRSHQHPGIPAFLQAILKRVFSSKGRLGLPDASDIRCVRQVCYLVYKLQLPYTPQQEKAVIDRFLANELELQTLEIPDSEVLDLARDLLSSVFEDFDPRDVLPRHGPGAVATGEKLDQKWCFKRLYDGIHQRYPYYTYFVAGGSSELLDRVKWYKGLSRETEGVAKVVLVPKDSRGPRLISCEPLEYQWIQQGLNGALVRRLESHKLTRGHVNFRDQGVNQRLAMESSTHHYYATLDLKDASDRVSCQLVEKIFPGFLVPFLMAVRSHATLLPDGRKITLKKYAPMGSATCFSVEAATFWAICVAAVSLELKVSIREAAQHVYVYGDDLIVPVGAFDAVVRALTEAGLTVNLDKSYHCGEFRESCGVDAFNGENVTPTKISTLWTGESSDGGAYASYIAYGNDLLQKGFYDAGTALLDICRSTYGNIPVGIDSAGYPCERVGTYSDCVRENLARNIRMRIHPRYQRVEFYVPTLVSTVRETNLDGWPRLLRHFVGLAGERPSEVVVPRSAKIRRRWRRVW